MIDLELEATLLGIVLQDNRQFFKLTVTKDDFSDDLNKRIFSAISESIVHGEEANPITLKPKFKGEEITYLAKILSLGTGIVSIKHYNDRVAELSKCRKAYSEIEAALEALRDSPATSLLEHLNLTLGELLNENKRILVKSVRAVSLDEAQRLQEKLPCFSTGIAALDASMEGGVYQRKSYCMAARPKGFKTMLLSTVFHNMATAGVKAVYIACEMGAGEIQQRSLARSIGRNCIAFVENRDDHNFIQNVINSAKVAPESSYYIDAPSMSFNALKQAIYLAKRNYGIEGFFLDYLQLVTGKPNKTSEAEFQAEVAQWIAAVCRKEDLFCVYAAQLNREGQVRGSDGIIMAADQVYYLHPNESKDALWMEQAVSRYTSHNDVGSEGAPVIVFDKHGPHLRDYRLT